jgi:hypothetical protein
MAGADDAVNACTGGRLAPAITADMWGWLKLTSENILDTPYKQNDIIMLHRALWLICRQVQERMVYPQQIVICQLLSRAMGFVLTETPRMST